MIQIPYNFTPRPYQLAALSAMDSGKLRAYLLWHRRSGKDICLWNYIIKRAFTEVGLYYYLLPTYEQARKVIWNGMTNDGQRFLDYAPEEIRAKTNDQQMMIELKNGSIIQLVGTDRFDGLRGTNPRGCVFSEFAFHNPMAWKIIRPILQANGGWGVFETTPNGKNHAHRMWEGIQAEDKWYKEKLTINDTNLLTWEQVCHEAKIEGDFDEGLLQQEYLCVFNAGGAGSIYAALIDESRKNNQITHVPKQEGFPVHVAFDLGRTDATAMIFYQKIGKELRIIDFYEQTGEAVGHYLEELHKRGYLYGQLFLPHDAFAERMESSKSIADQFLEAGFNVTRVPNHEILTGVQEARKMIPFMFFDKQKTEGLIEALEDYHWKYDENRKSISRVPEHNWASHSSDALRYLCMSLNLIGGITEKRLYKPRKTMYTYTDPLKM